MYDLENEKVSIYTKLIRLDESTDAMLKAASAVKDIKLQVDSGELLIIEGKDIYDNFVINHAERFI